MANTGKGFLRFDMRDPTRFVARLDRQMRGIDGSAVAPPPPAAAAPSEPAAAEDSGGLEKVSDNT